MATLPVQLRTDSLRAGAADATLSARRVLVLQLTHARVVAGLFQYPKSGALSFQLADAELVLVFGSRG